MPELDVRTLALLSMMTNVIFVTCLLIVRRMSPEEAGLDFWVRGASASALGNLLLLLRGSIPDLFSIVLANALFVWGYTDLYQGSRQFFGKSVTLRLNLALSALVFVCFAFLTYVLPRRLSPCHPIS